MHRAIDHRSGGTTAPAVFLPHRRRGDASPANGRRQDGWVVHVAVIGELDPRRDAGRLAFHWGPFHVAVCMVDAMDGLRIWSRRVPEVGGWRRKHELTSGLHDLELKVADLGVGAWPVRAPVADVIVVMVMVVDQVVNGGDALLAPAALAVVSAVGVDLFPSLALPVVVEAQCPPLDFPENVADVFEEFLVAAPRLGEAGDCAVV